MQLDRRALQVMAGEVGPVVDVKDIRDPAHRPRGSVFRQIACRNASAVFKAEGAPWLTTVMETTPAGSAATWFSPRPVCPCPGVIAAGGMALRYPALSLLS